MFNRKASTERKTTIVKPLGGENLPPECLRTKLVSTFGDQQGGLLKRSSTDELVRPGTLLGKGTFGVVKLRQDKTYGAPYAVKTMDKPAHWDRKRLVREAIVLMHLDHPYVQRIFGWHDDSTSITMVIEFCAGGELLDAIRESRSMGEVLRENWAAFMVKQLFEAMAYLHAKDLVHMDIKSGNILLLHEPQPDIRSLFKVPPHVVVADLGLAIVLDPTTSWFRKKLAKDAKGTPATMAPEVWRGEIGPKNDVWSLGCILYEVFCDRLPYLPEDPNDASQKTWENLYKQGEANCKQRLEVRDISAEVKRVCASLLTVDHKLRPNVKDLLSNAWFTRFLASGGMGSGLQVDDPDALANAMRRWEQLKPLHRAVCLKLASENRSAARFANVFSVFDTDGDGVLKQTELISGLRRLNIAEDAATNIAASLDFNGDGICEYVEFSAACLLSLGQEFEELLKKEWMDLDTFGDGKGKLKGTSFKKLVDKVKPLFAPREITVEEFVAGFGSLDGYLSFADFAAALGGVGITKPSTAAGTKKPEAGSQPKEEVVQYLSKSHGKWIDTTILERRADGAIQLDIKPGYWMEAEEQQELLRDSNGKPFPAKRTLAQSEDEGPSVTLVTNGTRSAAKKGAAKPKPAAKRTRSTENRPVKAPSSMSSNEPTRTDKRPVTAPSAKAMIGPEGNLAAVKKTTVENRSSASYTPSAVMASQDSVASSWAALPPENDERPSANPSGPSARIMFGPGGMGSFKGPSYSMSNSLGPTDGMLDASLPAFEEFKLKQPAVGSPTKSEATSDGRSKSPTDAKDAETNKAKKGKALVSPPGMGHSPRLLVARRSPEEHRRSLELQSPNGLGQQDSSRSDDGSQVQIVGRASIHSGSTDGSHSSRDGSGSHGLAYASVAQKAPPAPDGKPRSLKFDAKKNETALAQALEAYRETALHLSSSFDMPKQKDTKKSLLNGLKASLTGSKATKSKEKADEEAKAKEWAQFCKAYVSSPTGAPTVGRPIIVIDWDDTLVATTFIHREVMGGQPLHTLVEVHRQSKYYKDFVHYSHLVETVLRTTRRMGHVAVLTLASRWWIEASLDTYFFEVDMRAVLQELDIDVYHADLDAPTVLALTDPSARRSVAKRTAFSTCLKGFYGTDNVLWNVMSVGDAMVEHDALKAVLDAESKSTNSSISGLPLCKTVKFNSDPSLRDLIRQLECFLETVDTMITCDKSFHRVLV